MVLLVIFFNGFNKIISVIHGALNMKKIIVIITIFSIFLSVQNTYAQKTCTFNSKECFTKKGYPACRNRTDLDKYYEFKKSGKTDMAENILSDEKRCITLIGNARVALQYHANNKVKILFRGSNQSYWVINDAVYTQGD